MRKYAIWLSFLLVAVLPGVLASMIHKGDHTVESTDVPTEALQTAQTAYDIRVLDDGNVVVMDFEEYICGVLLGEIPADFQEEALKAQAVATRTYTLRRVLNAVKHENADLCTDPNCCQAYAFSAAYSGTAADIEKIAAAVKQTQGQVLTYGGELIEATYFSCSGGRTEAAVAVWGSDIPYLQSVESPGEENARSYQDEVVFSKAGLLEILGVSTEINEFFYSDIEYTEGGGVETINICGKVYSGTELRKILGLRSTAFTIEVETDRVRFLTKGYGHRVGMSQYGAEAMAQNGSSNDEILAYYYPQTQLVQMREMQYIALFDKKGNL